MNRRQLLAGLASVSVAAPLQRAAAAAEPKYHLRAGLVAYSYRKQLAAKSLSYDDLVRMSSDWGLDGLDCTVYWFPDTSAQFLASLRKTAFKHGIHIYNAGVRVMLCQPTLEKQLAELENIKKWVDVAERIGASHVRVFATPLPAGVEPRQAVAWAIEVMKRGAEYAGGKGITLGVEDDGPLTNTAEPTIEIARGAASPWAGINADSGNLRANGYEQFQMLLPYATSIHLKTTIATPEGKREKADWPRLLDMIGKSGYKGYVGLEYAGDDADAEVPRFAAELRARVRNVSL